MAEGILGDVVLAPDLNNELVALSSLLQDANDLVVGQLNFIHTSILSLESILSSQMVQFLGEKS